MKDKNWYGYQPDRDTSETILLPVLKPLLPKKVTYFLKAKGCVLRELLFFFLLSRGRLWLGLGSINTTGAMRGQTRPLKHLTNLLHVCLCRRGSLGIKLSLQSRNLGPVEQKQKHRMCHTRANIIPCINKNTIQSTAVGALRSSTGKIKVSNKHIQKLWVKLPSQKTWKSSNNTIQMKNKLQEPLSIQQSQSVQWDLQTVEQRSRTNTILLILWEAYLKTLRQDRKYNTEVKITLVNTSSCFCQFSSETTQLEKTKKHSR